MAKPSAWATDHGQATYRGGRPRLAPLQGWPVATKAAGAAASKRQLCRSWPGCKGPLLTTRPQGAAGDGDDTIKAKKARASF
ncbi:hypothetical protein GW17_00056787 [Ensete ventricosum]|nr:hypothetical protein GW17_00056787 [Ensete ventricosum]